MAPHEVTYSELDEVEQVDVLSDELIQGLVNDSMAFVLIGEPPNVYADLRHKEDISDENVFLATSKFTTEHGPATVIDLDDDIVDVNYV